MPPSSDTLRKIAEAAERNDEFLNLADLGGETLPDEIRSLTNLKTLILRGGRLRRLPDCLRELHSLEMIHISGHELDEFPPVLLEMPGLQTILLNSNRISAIPDEISRLPDLQVLDLTSNRIRAVPNAIATLHHLQNLGLGLNPIEQLPQQLDGLTALEDLGLEHTQLRSLPASIARLPKLQVLNLEGCPAVPEHLQHFFQEPRLFTLKATRAVKHWLQGITDPDDELFRHFTDFRLPADLLGALQSDERPEFNFEGADDFREPPFRLRPATELQVDWLDVRGRSSVDLWCVPVVRLMDEMTDEASWILLWLPLHQRYASFELEDRSLYVFHSTATWTAIAADFPAYFFATHCCGPVDSQYVQRYEESDCFQP